MGDRLLVQAYDPFGERRKSDWTGMLSASERQTLADNQPLKTSRGYTGHEHLDRTGFIHMNGRLYDPQLGRFLSPDPIVAAPGSSQSWNSYSYVSNSPLSFVDPGGQFQAGIGCNISYVMCMNGGNTSGGGGGGSGHGTETVPIRTFNFHIGINFARVPVIHDPIGSILGDGGRINDDSNGGIYSDVYFGDRPSISFELLFNFFISITSNTETREIQTAKEEQSPSSRPMGVGAQQADWTENWFGKGNHTYDRVSGAVCSTSECSQADAVGGLNEKGVHPNQTRAFVPGQPYTADVNLPGPFGRDDISTTAVYRDGVQVGIRNETLLNHALYPGVVERTIILQNGSYHIRTQGGGYGRWGGPNIWFDDAVWGPVDHAVIDGLR